MDVNILKILKYLSEETVGSKRNVSEIMNEIFPVQKLATDGANVKRFLEDLKKYTNYADFDEGNRDSQYGFIGFMLAINNDGVIALNKERDRLKEGELTQSAIDVNQSIKATNDSIKQTNKLMIDHAEKQEAIMSSQSDFIEQQVLFTRQQLGLIEKQNSLYKITLILTFLNIILGGGILWISISSNVDKQAIEQLNTEIVNQKKEIKQWQLLKSDTIHYVLQYPIIKSNLKKK
jgi:hypothetical protein